VGAGLCVSCDSDVLAYYLDGHESSSRRDSVRLGSAGVMIATELKEK